MWLVKSEEKEETPYGRSPEERSVEERVHNSVILVDKHAGPASQQITVWAKEMFGLKLAGHTGTLDPMVTGVLPIALDNAVKAMPVLMGLDKEYIGVMHLHKQIDESVLKGTVLKFVGRITQLPPVKSAVSRKPRQREIFFFDVLEMDGRDVLFRVGCQAGTYIRKLCSDIGDHLGSGAQMTELRRTRVGGFTEEMSHSLLEVKDAHDLWKEGDERQLKSMLMPVEHAISHVKKVFAKDSAIANVAYGSPLYASGIIKLEEDINRRQKVAIFSSKGELIALGESEMTSKEMLGSHKGTAVKTDRVFIGKGVFPRC
jgi:H/ACA ribonucleoprotein complex subunit 4